MTPTVRQILGMIEEIAPGDLAESWDNSGLCAGNLDWEAKKILVGLDPCTQVMCAAKEWGADVVLTHHPLFISSEKTIDFQTMPGCAISMAAREEISIICAHTNLDKAENGLNDFFSSRINILPARPLVADTGVSGHSTGGMTGIGRIGEVSPAVSLSQMALQIKKCLGVAQVRVVGDSDRMIRQVAVCTGSGGSLIPAFLASGADLYITGDVKYHYARLIEDHDRALIDVGHFASEIIAVDLLSSRVGQLASRAGYELEIKGFNREKDPFTLV